MIRFDYDIKVMHEMCGMKRQAYIGIPEAFLRENGGDPEVEAMINEALVYGSCERSFFSGFWRIDRVEKTRIQIGA